MLETSTNYLDPTGWFGNQPDVLGALEIKRNLLKTHLVLPIVALDGLHEGISPQFLV
jgi:hypothetical protein